MKRSVVAIVSVVVLALGVVACGGSDGGDTPGGKPIGFNVADDAKARATCADARLEQNLTPDQYARAFAEYFNANVPNAQPITPETIEFYRKDVESAITKTPPGGQGQFGRAVCLQYAMVTRDLGATPQPRLDLTTSLLSLGYVDCTVMQAIANGLEIRDDPDLQDDVARGNKYLGFLRPAAHKYLCPYLPDIAYEDAPPEPTGAAACLNVKLPGIEYGSPGTITVVRGGVSCEDARKVMRESARQIENSGGSSTTYEINGTTHYICGEPEVSVEYDYKCDSPMGDKLITWKRTE